MTKEKEIAKEMGATLVEDTKPEIVKDAAENKEEIEKVASEKAKETVSKKSVLYSAARKADGVLGRIKNTFHGFFIVFILIAVIAAGILYKTNNTNTITITLPTLQLSYLKIAIMAAVIALLGTISTSSKK